MQIPGMNGIGATQKIRQSEVTGVNPELPIIALTANGMNDYLSKPVSVKELTRVLGSLVTSDSSEQLK